MDLLLKAWYWLLVIFGVGGIIFVHELGHFLAARLCKVRVEVFSLGFGPRLFGWRRGETLYQLAALPLGGFVRMAGEDTLGDDARPPGPDDLRSKTVGQRFLVFSGGVVMNVVLALIVFPILFTVGVPFYEPVLGTLTPGGPAWKAGLQPGTRVVSVNGREVIGFFHIRSEVALGSPDRVTMEVIEPGAPLDEEGHPRVSTVELEPAYDERFGFSKIEVSPALDPELALGVAEDSPAWEAGVRPGDLLIGVEGGLPEASLVERFAEEQDRGGPLEILVSREGRELRFRVEPEPLARGDRPMLGVAPVLNRVRALRGSALASELDLLENDQILSANGRQLLVDLDLHRGLLAAGDEIALEVLRRGRRIELRAPAPERSARWQLAEDIALAGDVDGTRVTVRRGSPAERAGMLDGDEVTRIGGISTTDWDQLQDRTKKGAQAGSSLAIEVQREDARGGTQLLKLDVQPEPLQEPWFGLSLRVASYDYTSASLPAAIADGVYCSWNFLADAWITVKRMLLRQISGENLGGIITIANVSYSQASIGWTKLLFFLCMLSVHLAFLNVLPIPVLDGGHLFFLLIEKIKGSPVSERVMGYSQMVGLVMILSLMIYVTFNDVMRWFFPA